MIMTKTPYLKELYKDLSTVVESNLTNSEIKKKTSGPFVAAGTTSPETPLAVTPASQKFFDCGIYLGHKSLKLKNAWHCSVSTFLLGSRNSSAVFKTKYTLTCFLKAIYVLTLIIKSKGQILIINTNPEFSKLLKHTKKNANSSQIFYSDCDWVGGTLTNWAQIYRSVNTFINFYHKFDDFLLKNNINFPRYKKMKKSFRGFINEEKQQASIKSYFIDFPLPSVNSTKKTRSYSSENRGARKRPLSLQGQRLRRFPSEMQTQKITFLGYNWKPDLLFILDSNGTEAIIKEASKLQIPIVALIDSNTNISNITYPIPTNTNSFVFAWFCLDCITRIINKYSLKAT